MTHAGAAPRGKRQYLGWREFLLRQLVRTLAVIFYRRSIHNVKALDAPGPALIIANHLTFVDWLFISSICPRPVRFVMDHQYMEMPAFKWAFNIAQVIAIAPAKENPELLESAYAQIGQSLRDGGMVCIFPEGQLSKNGSMTDFRPGILRILEDAPVPVIPVGLPSKLWNSRFSRNKNRPSWFARILNAKIRVHVGQALPPTPGNLPSLPALREKVQKLVDAADQDR